MAAAAILSRRDPTGLTPTIRAGTVTYVSIITPTTMPREIANHGCPQRGTTIAETPRARPTASPTGRTTPRWRRASVNAGRILGLPDCDIAKANTALR